jgi:hypothetical protein
MAKEEFWEGTCKQLLHRLEQDIDDRVRQSRDWPRSPRALSSRLKRLVTFLRESHILVTFHPRGTKGQRIVTITRGSGDSTVTTATTVTPPDGSPLNQSVTPEGPGDGPGPEVTDYAPAAEQPPPEPSEANSLEVRDNERQVAVVTVVTVDSHIQNDKPHLIGDKRLAYDAA